MRAISSMNSHCQQCTVNQWLSRHHRPNVQHTCRVRVTVTSEADTFKLQDFSPEQTRFRSNSLEVKSRTKPYVRESIASFYILLQYLSAYASYPISATAYEGLGLLRTSQVTRISDRNPTLA